MSIPFQATHTADDGRYYMVDGCEWFYANAFGHWKRHWSGAPAGLKEIKKAKKWSGPQDGLPPVGSIVEVFECTHDYTKRFNGQKVRILCHENDVAVFSAKNFEYHALVKDKFRPIRTPEQIADEQRETAIREIMDIVGIDCRVAASKAVDAGFKREVV